SAAALNGVTNTVGEAVVKGWNDLTNAANNTLQVTPASVGLDGGTVSTVPLLSIAADQSGMAEGDSGTTDFTFTVPRSGNPGAAVSALWSVAGSGATPAYADDF